MRIDLNLDAGERPQALIDGTEARLYKMVSSVNIACGGHAGDQGSMREAVKLAKSMDLAIGAHPSYPDRAGFGRERINISPDALLRSLCEQISAIKDICDEFHTALAHVKAHGSLYNVAAENSDVADIVIEAIRRIDGNLRVVGLAGSQLISRCRQAGMVAVGEAFVDRRYETATKLRSREEDDALIRDPREAAKQALSIVREHEIETALGTKHPIYAETLCIHGDVDDAVSIATAVRRSLQDAGVVIAALGKP